MTRRTDTEREPARPGQRASAPTPPSPLPAPPTGPRTPIGTARKPAQPGARGDAPSDMAVTSRLERINLEPLPAPLPPSPATADADRYFEQVPTNPGALSRRAPTANDVRAASGLLVAPMPPPQGPRPWVLPALMIATALAVGMVLGALLFGYRGTAQRCAPCANARP